MIRFSALLATVVVTPVWAQCHGSSGKGLSKNTFAGSANVSFAVIHQLTLLFNVTPAEDSTPGNVYRCDAGTSGTTADWYITMNRAETIMPTHSEQDEYGGPLATCAVFHAGAAATSNAQPRRNDAPMAEDEPLYVTLPSTLGDDCLFAEVGTSLRSSDAPAYTANAHTPGTCCNTCAADPNCAYAVYSPPGSTIGGDTFAPVVGGGKFDGPQPGECFGMHVTSVPGHSTVPGLSVEEVEQIFTSKFAASLASNATYFDPFLDFSTAMFTADLDGHLRRLDATETPYLAAVWPYGSNDTSGTGYSVFVQIGGSQLIVELVATASETLSAPESSTPVVALEQRMTASRLEAFAATPPDGLRLALASVNRAASTNEMLSEIRTFYTEGVGASVTAATTTALPTARGTAAVAALATKECYLWPGAGSDVCFTVRPEITSTSTNTTSGGTSSFGVADMETMLSSVHNAWLNGAPSCAMDRWVDNHYAVDLDGDFQALLDFVVENGLPYTCGSDPFAVGSTTSVGAHYVFDPTGWGIQLDIPFSTTLPGCEDAAALGVSGSKRGRRRLLNGDDADDDWIPSENGWCDGGTCVASKNWP